MQTNLIDADTLTEKDSLTSKLDLRITWKFLFALLALTICTGELHEQAHIQTGRLLCGDYGARDFNVWTTTADCATPDWAYLATLAGPLWSYAVMWIGAALLLKARFVTRRAFGFTLIFAPLPFARIFTAVIGGGDEKVVLHSLLPSWEINQVKFLAVLLVTLICLPPIVIAWHSFDKRLAWLYTIGFAMLPLIVLGIYMRILLNYLLSNGFLSAPLILGTPTLILAHFLLMAILLICSRRWLLGLSIDTN